MLRTILHSDLNSFYASVEMMLDPSLRGKAVAVCGSTEDRHGIVLAKSELAKKAGVKTGMVNWEAKQKCPGIIMLPPQYEQYLKYSKLTREIYQRYTDQVEPYGMDECWIDITGSCENFGGGLAIAEQIRQATREELGLTVSIGVSFTKIFAKLGSDMKKPDAITCINADDYKDNVWPLPASELLYVGHATEKALATYGIHTIGGIANASPDFLHRRFGKNGDQLWRFANGTDTSRVMQLDYEVPIKSIGHGITCNTDLELAEEVWKIILFLSQDLGHRLRMHELCAKGVQLTVKDNTLAYKQYQAQLDVATQSAAEIAALARRLFNENYQWRTFVRAITVRAINLIPRTAPQQLTLFDNTAKREKLEKLETAVDSIRHRFGKGSVSPAAILSGLKIPGHCNSDLIMPGVMFV